MAAMNGSQDVAKTPVYFFSHGGPTITEMYDHPAYKVLQQLGREITTEVKPKAVVVFSAHWQAGRNKIEVNTAESTDLIYDFYNFPPHFYEMKFPNVGSKAVAQQVMASFEAAGIESKGVTRGLDHGVWASFYCAFNPVKNPLEVPIVQVSLFDSDDGDQHFRLGQAIEDLRRQGIAIIVSGMAVHNLGDFRKAGRLQGQSALPYTVTFDNALRDAVQSAPEGRQAELAKLLERSDARKAHPSFEHLLPIYIGAGAAGNDSGKQIFTFQEGSLSWAQYRFGEVAAAA